MKKGLLGSLFCMFLLTACGSKGITVISAEDAVKKIDNKESMVLVVGSTTCHACQSFEPVLEEVQKNYPDLPLFKVYIDDEDPITVEGEEDQVRVNFRELESRTTAMPSTPTTLFIKDGEMVSDLVGNKEYTKVVSKLESSGFISKE